MAERPKISLGMSALDDLFKNEQELAESKLPKLYDIPLDRMCPKDGTLKDYERYYRQRNAGESIIQALREAFSLYERDTGGFI